MIEQRFDGDAQLTPGRAAARMDDQEAIAHHFAVSHLAGGAVFILDIGVDETADQIVLGFCPPLVHHAGQHLGGIGMALRHFFRRAVQQQRLAEFERFGRRNAEPGGDDAHRQRRAQLQIEIGMILFAEAVKNLVYCCVGPHVRPPAIGEGRLEPRLGDVAQALVLATIKIEQRITERGLGEALIDAVAERLGVHEHLVHGFERQHRIDLTRPVIGIILARNPHQVFQIALHHWRAIMQFCEQRIGIGSAPACGGGLLIGVEQGAAIILRKINSCCVCHIKNPISASLGSIDQLEIGLFR